MALNGPKWPPYSRVKLCQLCMMWGHSDPYGSKTAIEHQTFDTSLTFWPAMRSKKDKVEIFNPPLESSSRWLGDGPPKNYISSILAKVTVVDSHKYKKGLN